ncbi:related to single-stranded DNA-binding protein [Ramularia collo-cygni]|uniref:Related to single-stranded DNA-binding protein n=1 Tax=Ramularia collo-cygni TaxID=112498 RepID=A0A2D3V0D2_9PEZI|nr:related to single-stranded DNA-binding protein [Ramularia collo-cygni]CZT21238.1 related to single-stranded DNA-binding protein [Ramularia collo-cygni]
MLALFRNSLPRAATRAFSTTAARPLAKMQIIGRLADTPELFDTASGKQIVRYALGVSAGPRDEQGNRSTSWFRVASFMQEGPQRELLLSLPKGSQLYVEAEARMDSYETEDGQKRTALNLLQRSFETLSSKPRDGSAEGSE